MPTGVKREQETAAKGTQQGGKRGRSPDGLLIRWYYLQVDGGRALNTVYRLIFSMTTSQRTVVETQDKDKGQRQSYKSTVKVTAHGTNPDVDF
jgi:hypothetical protein